MSSHIEGQPTQATRQEFVANLHTDAAPSIVNGLVVEGTDSPKDLAERNDTSTPLILVPRKGDPVRYANQWDLQRAIAGNEKLTNLVAFTAGESRETGEDELPENLLAEYRLHDAVYSDLYVRAADRIMRVTNHVELQQVMNSDMLGAIQSIEGVYGDYTEYDIEEIAKTAKIWTVWWNFSDARTGTDNTKTGTKADTGLTDEGRNLIATLSKDLGVAVDLSHASDQTTIDVLETIAKAGGIPAVATHSGLRDVEEAWLTGKPHNRNLTDHLAQAIVAQDGIIGVPFTATFMKDINGVKKTFERFAKLGIIDHIALGPDFDGMPSHRAIPEIKDPEATAQNLPGILRSLGLSEQEVRGIMFENAYRYFDRYVFPAPKAA